MALVHDYRHRDGLTEGVYAGTTDDEVFAAHPLWTLVGERDTCPAPPAPRPAAVRTAAKKRAQPKPTKE